MKNRSRLPNVYMGAILSLMYLPILIFIIYSFNKSRLNSVWGGFSLSWYAELFKDRSIFEALINSLILAGLSSLSATIIGTLGAVGMAKSSLPGKGIIEYMSTMPIMIPEIILGMVFLVFFSLVRLPFGMVTLVIAHTAFGIPYVYLQVKARLAGMDESYAEAAKDLGASDLRVFIKITLPLIMPAVMSGMLLAFAMSFDDVIISLFVTGINVNTLPMKIYTQLKTGVTPKINALCTLMFAATLLICFIASRFGKKEQ